MTETEYTSDVEIKQLFDWEANLPCSFAQCQQEAKWFLICGTCGIGRETVCQEHKAVFEQAGEWDNITFDQTCGHHPFLVNCTWEPIT